MAWPTTSIPGRSSYGPLQEAGDGDVNQVVAIVAERVVPDTQSFGDAGSEVLDDDIGHRDEFVVGLASGVALEIDRRAALVPVERRKDCVAGVAGLANHVTGSGPFDFDHVGTEIAEHESREGCRDEVAEFDDGDSGQRKLPC